MNFVYGGISLHRTIYGYCVFKGIGREKSLPKIFYKAFSIILS